MTTASPVAISSRFGSGSHSFASPISKAIPKYRESHCVPGFQMSPMKITGFQHGLFGHGGPGFRA